VRCFNDGSECAIHRHSSSVRGELEWCSAVHVGVGSNGGQKYLFDTGSNSFNLEATSATLGSQLSSLSQQANLPTDLHYSYSSGLALYGNQVGVPSLTFYTPASDR